MRMAKAFWLLPLFVFFSFSAQAKIIHVPTDSSTIQGGINGAVNGDTVLVALGTYYEHIDFYGKSILVKSQAGAESTILSKLYDGFPIVTFHSGEDTNSIIDGFTIQDAKNTEACGGAIYCFDYSSPTIRNNILKSNLARWGGGIACWSSSPIIENNHIVGNTSLQSGGGIYVYNWCSPIIRQNLLTENSGAEGAIFCDYSSPQIVNNTLDRNKAGSGSIVCRSFSSPQVKNTIISNGTGYGIYAQGNSFPTITYCDVWNNASGNLFGCMPGAGYISAGPIFCDTASDSYYLSNLSPCVGGGEGGTDIGAFGVGCGRPRDVDLTSGPNKAGRAQTNVVVEFYVRNSGFLSDTYDLNITDSLGWAIVPTHYEVPLDSAEVDTVTFTVSIPYVPIGTVDKLRLTAMSQADSSVVDTAYLTVTCNAIVEGVEVTAGSNQSGYADSIVSIAFVVQNVGVVTDSYSLNISDTKGWNIIPLHYNITLDTGKSDPVGFTVSIPYVPLGTTDFVTLLAVSKTNPLARDSATLIVTCNAYVEGLDLSSGEDIGGKANSHVMAKFYVQNTGLAPDSCSIVVSDPLGWNIQPPSYRLSLSSGQKDSVLFDVSIPSVSVGTTDKITLKGLSLTNPFVKDSTFLLTTCSSYNVTIHKISDVGNDQGKQVRIDWLSFPGSDPLVKNFTVFRKVDSLLFASLGVNQKTAQILVYPPGRWEMVGTYPAFGETLYSATVPTLKDSTKSDGMYWSVFFVRAGTDNPVIYFDSPIDSGYSLDNLVPSTPIGLLASHLPAKTKLKWAPVTDPDFNYYALYRDTTDGFNPNPNNSLPFTIDTLFIDSTAQLGKTYYYLVSAVDFSGNEGNPSNQVMGVRYITGDVNTSGTISLADVIYLANYILKGGSIPLPIASGDVNCDGKYDLVDVIRLANYLLKSGPQPCE
jgi:hypothetical protein